MSQILYSAELLRPCTVTQQKVCLAHLQNSALYWTGISEVAFA